MPYLPSLSRRSLIKLAGAGFVGLQIPGRLVAQSADVSNPALPMPETWSSVNGELGGPLPVVFNEFEIGGGQTVYSRTYAGTVPGPILRVNPGDIIALIQQNQLPPNPDGHHGMHGHDGGHDHQVSNPNLPHQWNTTNLHTHGLHVSPLGNGDNVFLRIDPGEEFAYSIAIPDDHVGGLFWYHPHKHGGVHQQVRSGMAGALIISGPLDDVPEIAAATELVLVLQTLELTYDDSLQRWEVAEPDQSGQTVPDIFPVCASVHTVNGLTGMHADVDSCEVTVIDEQLPYVTMQPGELQRWRILNASSDIYMELVIVNEQDEEQEFASIAVDGLTFSEPVFQTKRLVTTGNRLEILFKPAAEGTYYLKKTEYAHQIAGPSVAEEAYRLMKVVVQGAQLDMPFPTELPSQVVDIAPHEVQNTREVLFSIVPGNPPEFLMNGRLFDANRIDHVVQLGAVEEWTIRNTSNDEHNFHIHQNPFMVTEINGVGLDNPLWYDTFNVTYPEGGEEGTFKFRTRFQDFVGKYVAHCHLLDHEELGMMQVVQVVDHLNGLSMEGSQCIVYFAEGVENRDRVQLYGYLDLAPGQSFELPFDEDVVINVLASNPDPSADKPLLPVMTDTISAGTVRKQATTYNYIDKGPGLRGVVFRLLGRGGVFFRVTCADFDFLPEERAALSPDEYRNYIESINNLQLLISAGNNAWLQDIPVTLGNTTERAVMLDGSS